MNDLATLRYIGTLLFVTGLMEDFNAVGFVYYFVI